MTRAPADSRTKSSFDSRIKKKTPPYSPKESDIIGRIILAHGNRLIAVSDGRKIECSLRGKMRHEAKGEASLVVTGDLVRIDLGSGDEGVIEEVLPRKTVLARARPMKPPQILAANVDQALIVFAAAHPDPDAYMMYQLDKMLVQAQAGGLIPVICCNKIDLNPEAVEIFQEYEKLGYVTIFASATTGSGLEELRSNLAGKLNVLCGPSGVGKSSLINALRPDLHIRVGDVSDWTGKGRHTTTSAEMHSLGDDAWIVDTPGIHRLELWEVPKEDVESYFPEIRDLWKDCANPDCLHAEVERCAVMRAVEEGKISRRRYESYKSIVQGR